MFNFYNNVIQPDSIADFGAQRTLGMNGSLMGYIQTGNQYDKHYYNKPCQDVFEKNKKSQKAKQNKIITALALAAGAVIGAFVLLKKGIKIDLKKINLKKLIPDKLSKKSGDFLDDCFDSAQKHLEKVRAKQA